MSPLSTLPVPPSTPAPGPGGWRLDHSYSRLPEVFHVRVDPTAVPAPRLVVFNRPLARSLGLDPEHLDHPERAVLFAGNALPPGALPLAQAYAGHQYGRFTRLGDGRALLLGEQITPDGLRFDIQLKGSGPTPFSRGGDGRAALGPMLREYVISEAMHALGIPTTRSLAVAVTGEPVFRETVLPGAVLTRVAASHIRVGTFEWAAASGTPGALEALAEHTARRHYPGVVDRDDRWLALLHAIMDRQARLVARWQLVGFVHGVMNTDNMALSGETIDFGPCAFMDAYDPATVFSSIDHHGRYAYGQQPLIAHWNLARLASAMLPLFDPDEARAVALANEALQTFPARFQEHWLAGMRSKLGLLTSEADDTGLIDRLLDSLRLDRLDFTNTFRDLSTVPLTGALLGGSPAFQDWQRQWLDRLRRQSRPLETAVDRMRLHNPVVVPRNHKVEEGLSAATACGDLKPLQQLLDVLARPYDYSSAPSEFSLPAGPGQGVYRTFCGT